MTPAILFHQTQEFLLHSEQNRIVSALNAHCPAFYPVYPLWCFLTGKDVRMLSSKELKRLLARVEIKSPKVDGKNLVFPVGIRLTSGIHIEEKIIFAVRARQNDGLEETKNENAVREAADGLFPLPCRIFRIAEIETDGTQFDAFNAVWVKAGGERQAGKKTI